MYDTPRFKKWLKALQIKNDIITDINCRVGSSGQFDLICIAVAQFLMKQFKLEFA